MWPVNLLNRVADAHPPGGGVRSVHQDDALGVEPSLSASDRAQSCSHVPRFAQRFWPPRVPADPGRRASLQLDFVLELVEQTQSLGDQLQCLERTGDDGAASLGLLVVAEAVDRTDEPNRPSPLRC